MILLETNAPAIGRYFCVAERRSHRVVKNEMKTAAVNAEFRIRITGILAARLPVNELAKSIEEATLPVLDTDATQRVLQSQCGQLPHGMR